MSRLGMPCEMQDVLTSMHHSSWVKPISPDCRVRAARGVEQGNVPAANLFMCDHREVAQRTRVAMRELGVGVAILVRRYGPL
eukprot:11863950-Alexandrium_andersonii.AAC.1